RAYDGRAISELARDPVAVELGRAIFANTCATCHGSTAQGAVGYPNLTDDIWHWGGSEERILETILDGREGVMPEWGTGLTGIDGKGNPDLGAPDLTDDYAMYGSSTESIMETIRKGRHGVMPAHRDLLGETRSRLVASYVWSLSNGGDASGEQAGAP